MRGKPNQRILSWILCFTMLFGMLPGALAWSEDDPDTDAIEIAFFKVDPEAEVEKPTASNAVTDYEIEYSDDSIKKGTTGAGYDNGPFYLETAKAPVGSSVTISDIEIPEGTYRVDLIHKPNNNRASIECSLDKTEFQEINLTEKSGTKLDTTTLLNGNARESDDGKYYAMTLSESMTFDETTTHEFTATVTAEGVIVLYGLIFTPPAALTLDKDAIALDLLSAPTATVTATLGEGYEVLSWESDDEDIAAVKADDEDETSAVITATGVGETTITVTAENVDGDEKTKTVAVTVTKSDAITLSRSSLAFNLGESSDPATVTATYNSLFDNLTWESDNEDVATITAEGDTATITPIGQGSATITASVTRKDDPDETASATLEVTVEQINRIPITLKSDLSPKVLTLNAEQQYIRVAEGSTVGDLLDSLEAPKTRSDIFSVQSSEGATKERHETLLSSDILVVEYADEVAHYSLIVEGDKTSTAIVVKTDPYDFEFGMQGSNIGEITDDSITLIDGKVRRIWVADTTKTDNTNDKALAKQINKSTYTGSVGRLQALRSCSEIITQLESANGTAQSYQITSSTGAVKTSALPADGDKLIVTAADGSTKKEYTISIVEAAVNGRLDLSQTEMTVDTAQTLVLEYYAGQRTPEATVDIDLPAGMSKISESDITINVIGRGDVAFADFSESSGTLNADGTFTNEKMHQVLGRLASDYAYQTLGTVTLTDRPEGGQTLRFTGLDLRPNNGADLRIAMKGVEFDTLGDHDFSARLTTADSSVDRTLSGLRSTGKGSETASLTVKNTVSDLKRLPYDPGLAAPSYKYENGGVTGLSYLDYSEMGELYTSAYLSWTPAADASSVTLYTSKGTVGDNGAVTPGSWDAGTQIPNSGSYTVTNLDANAYYQFKLEVNGGSHAGDSNIIEHYSGKLDATKFGLAAGTGADTARANKAALNRAISWLNSIGGGTLNIPGNGNNDAPLDYPTGTVYLKSNVYLYIETGARLHAQSGVMDGPESAWWSFGDYASGTNASEDPYANPDNFLSKQDDGHCFFQNCMIYARRADNIKIVGTGRLDGNGVLQTGDGTIFKQATNKQDDLFAFKLCTNIEVGGKNTCDDLIYDITKAGEYVKQTNTVTPGLSYKKSGESGLANMLYIDRGGHFVMLSTGSDNVHIHDVYYQRYNTGNARDVWDFMGNRNVYAVNIFAASCSDDIIKLGSDCSLGFSRPVANYKVRNIIGDTNCNNLQIGSETADDTLNVDVDNLVVLGANKAGFSISTNDGALVKNITLNEGNTGAVYTGENGDPDSGYFQRTRTPIFISISHRGRIIGAENYTTPGGERAVRNVAMGHVTDISFKHVKIADAYSGSTYSGNFDPIYQPAATANGGKGHTEFTSVVVGYKMPEGVTAADMPDGRATGYVENAVFEDVELTVKGYNKDGNYPFETTENTCKELNVGQYNSPDMGVRPSYGFYVRHAKNITFKDVTLDFEGLDGGTDDRYPIVFDDVQGAVMNNVTMTKGLGVNGLVQLRESSGISLTGCGYVEKSAMDTRISVEDANNLTGGDTVETWTVYPTLRAVFDILLAVSDNAEDVKELDNVQKTVTVFADTTVSSLLDQVKSRNTLSLSFEVQSADGQKKDAGDMLADGDRLVVTCAAENAQVNEKTYGILLAERPLPKPQGESFFVVYYDTDGTKNPTLHCVPEKTLASGHDSGPYYLQIAGTVDEEYRITVPVEQAGKYRVDLVIKQNANRATVQNYLDDIPLSDPFHLGIVTDLVDAGADIGSTGNNKYYYRPLTEEIELAAGDHTFKSVVTAAGNVVIYGVRLTRLDVPVTGVQVSPAELNIYSNTGSQTAQLTASVQPADASNQNVVWTSSDKSVATVSADGLVTIKGNGRAVITATTEDGGFTASCNVTVSTYSNNSGNSGSGSGSGSGKPSGSTTEKPATTPKRDTDDNSSSSKQTESSVPAANFPDVEPSDWFAPAVNFVSANGLMAGSGGHFTPNNSLTRAMIAQILFNMDGAAAANTFVRFPDVKADDWYVNAVSWSVSRSFMSGYGNGNFGPNDAITREQLAVVLYNYAQAKGYNVSLSGSLESFADGGAVSDWAAAAVRWAVGSGLLSGKSGGRLDPSGTATRAEVAQILMTFCQKIAG